MNLSVLKQKSGRASPEAVARKKELYSYAQLQRIPSQSELFILFSLQAAGEKGVYGLDIQRAVQECSGGEISLSSGSLYSLLKRLRNKGLLDSYEGDALGGGAKRHYYSLTKKGKTIVSSVVTFFSQLQEWVPE